MRHALAFGLVSLLAPLSGWVACGVAEGAVKISCDYPGGNVKVVDVKPTVVTVDSDLRDTPRDWFYWNFEAESDVPPISKKLSSA